MQRLHGLLQERVRTGFQGGVAGGDGGHGEDGQWAVVAHLSTHREPGAAGDHQVQDEQIGAVVGNGTGDVIAVAHDGGEVALRAEKVLGEFGGVGVAFGEQDRQRCVVDLLVPAVDHARCVVRGVRPSPPTLREQSMRIGRLKA